MPSTFDMVPKVVVIVGALAAAQAPAAMRLVARRAVPAAIVWVSVPGELGGTGIY